MGQGSRPGVLITLEGGEGVGKTTQAHLLGAWLRSLGLAVIQSREPGGTAVGERLRQLLLDRSLGAVDPASEVLLFAASRSESIAHVLLPALKAGAVVISDRFVDSSLAYQGYGLGVHLGWIRAVHAAAGDLWPDLTVVLDLPAGHARPRQHPAAGPADRIEARPAEYHRRVREGYRALAQAEPERIRLVDARGSVAEVQAALRGLVEALLRRRRLWPGP